MSEKQRIVATWYKLNTELYVLYELYVLWVPGLKNLLENLLIISSA